MWRASRLSDSRLAQQQRKGKLQLESLTARGIDAMVPGAGDLALGLGWLQEQAVAAKVPYVAANLTCGEVRPFPALRTVDKSGVKVAIIGVLSPNDSVPEGCAVGDPEEAVKATLMDAGAPHLTVVLSRLDEAADARLGLAVPDVDLVIAGGSKAPRPTPTLMDSGAARIQHGARGKTLGIAELTILPEADRFSGVLQIDDLAGELERMKKRLVSAEKQLASAPHERAKERAERRLEHYKSEIPKREAAIAKAREVVSLPAHTIELTLKSLDDRVADHADTLAAVEKANADITAFTLASRPQSRAEQGPFIGSRACLGCHPAESAQWKSTRHASAWQTLQAEQRHMDMACWSCHATGAFHAEGPQHPASAGDLENVGCEACHGPGRAHAAKPTTAKMVASPEPEACTTCHDGEQDGGRFDLDSYLPKVVHAPAGQ